MQRPYFRPLYLVESHLPKQEDASTASGAATAGKAGADTPTVLKQSLSVAVAAEHIVQWIVTKLLQIRGLPVEEINVDRPANVNGIN
ncbi:hypothetical protein ACMYSQ_011242 [Aspergillus niger]